MAEIRCTMCGSVGDAGAPHPYDLCSRIAELQRENERLKANLRAERVKTINPRLRDGWTREWRAVASGDPAFSEDATSAWTPSWDRVTTTRDALREDFPHDDVWIETRTVSPLERVSEEKS